MRLFVRIAAVALAIGVVTPGLAARQKSPQNANYRLAATLDTANHTIAGRGRLTWRNIASKPATDLRFHMYWNAWRDPSSTWFRELRDPMADRASEDPGSIDLTSFSLVTAGGAQDLLPRVQYIAPDDGNAHDRTVLSVPLDKPVSPGGVIDIDLAWTSRVPRTFARTGVLGHYFFIGHWFPKIAVLEDTGWNSHQFHGDTEFFADYGVYDVSLTVPSGWIVGATGREQSRTDNRDGTTHPSIRSGRRARLRMDDEPGFRRCQPPCRLCRRRAGVDVRLLLQPEHRNQTDRHFDAAARGVVEVLGMVRAVPVRAAHHRRPGDRLEPGGARRRDRRHGVPDAHHGWHSLVHAVEKRRP